MKQTGKCPKCGSTDIVANAQVIDRLKGAELNTQVAICGKPEALISKDKRRSNVFAWVCTGCGFTELYTENPEKLRLPKTQTQPIHDQSAADWR